MMAPDLSGRRVMVLPVQQVMSVGGDADAELAFGLESRGPEVTWVLPAEVDRVLARSPSMDARTRGLPVDAFLAAEVRRVGDPLYGTLRRLAALVDTEVALLPVRAQEVSTQGDSVRVRFHSALLDVRTGRVLWFAVEEGETTTSGDPRALATAADAVARRLLRR